MKTSLTQKIFAGNFLLLAVIVSMVIILIHEHRRMREIDAEMHNLQSVRSSINVAQLNITELAIMGENVLSWENTDLTYYHKKRLSTDSLLQVMSPRCRDYVRTGQIDTLRQLLEEKEMLLSRVMKALSRQKTADSLLINHLPEVAKRATRIRTVKQKRPNLLGALGSKKTVQVLPSAKELHFFSDSLIAIQQEGTEEMEANADNLRVRNLSLNSQLNLLIKDLEKQVRAAFAQREQKIIAAQNLSVRLYSITLIISIILLVVFHIAIYKEIRRKINAKKKREILIGKLQESNDKNKQLLQFRHKLMQTVTHEMRTSLTAVSGNAELLLRDDNADDIKRHTQAIRESAERMTSMTNELLEFFRLDSQKERLNIRPFRSGSIAETLETEFIPLADAKRLDFIVSNDTNEVLSGDKERILRIGSNLLSNALKFTKTGHVTLSTQYKDGIFTLSVQDTGSGIRKDKQELVFAPFERLGNAITQDGFGLGLAIVSSLVKLMNGSISIESEPEKGSRFTVTLPLPKAEEIPVERIDRKGLSPLAGCSVLAIDNDPVTLRLMREMYLQNGIECDCCLSVSELTNTMRNKDYDLLITDLRMPEVNGYELLELLRTSEIGNSRTIPVVAVTAAGYVPEEELKKSGFSALLTKPFSIDELMDVTQRCASRKLKSQPDFSALLAFGNRHHTLEQLITETKKEMEEIRKATDAKDMEALDNWVHHLRSSWMVIRTEQPLQALYEAMHKDPHSDMEVTQASRAVLEQGKIIIERAEKEMQKWEE